MFRVFGLARRRNGQFTHLGTRYPLPPSPRSGRRRRRCSRSRAVRKIQNERRCLRQRAAKRIAEGGIDGRGEAGEKDGWGDAALEVALEDGAAPKNNCRALTA